MGTALDVVRPGGRVSVIGVIMSAEVTIPFLPALMGKNLTLRSGLVNPQVYFPKLLPLIRQGRIDPSQIITHRLPLSEGVKGYEIFDAHQDDVLKVVLEP
jgi:S-(hydroxymethyl)glutathione dehydrogenase/alcohol dehydrogenase